MPILISLSLRISLDKGAIHLVHPLMQFMSRESSLRRKDRQFFQAASKFCATKPGKEPGNASIIDERDVKRERSIHCPGRIGSIWKDNTDGQISRKNRKSRDEMQVDKVSWYLRSSGILTVDRTTTIGKMIDAYLRSAEDLDDHVIHLLFSANRWEARWKRLSSGTDEVRESNTISYKGRR
jgi:hypothetical protein